MQGYNRGGMSGFSNGFEDLNPSASAAGASGISFHI